MPRTETRLAFLRIITDEHYSGVMKTENIGKLTYQIDKDTLKEQFETHGIDKILVGIANFTAQLIKLHNDYEKSIK